MSAILAQPFVLVSYEYRETLQATPILKQCRMLVDSGAYSAHHKGKKITIDEYTAFVNALDPETLDGYFNLDVINDPNASEANYRALQANGLSPIPIFVYGMNWAQFRRYAGEAKYVAVAGGGKVRDRVYQATRIARELDAHVHAFGVASVAIMTQARPYSCDVSTIASTQRWGTAKMFHAGKWWNLTRKDVLRYARTRKFNAGLATYGFSLKDLNDSDFWTWHGGGSEMTARSYLRLQKWLLENANVRLYFALGAAIAKSLLERGMKKEAEYAEAVVANKRRV